MVENNKLVYFHGINVSAQNSFLAHKMHSKINTVPMITILTLIIAVKSDTEQKIRFKIR